VRSARHAGAVPGELVPGRRPRLCQVTEGSRLSLTGTREGHVRRVRAQGCRTLYAYIATEGSPCQPRSSVGGLRSKCRRTALLKAAQGICPINDKSNSMAVHGHRKPPITQAPGQKVPGATPVIFPSTKEISRGLNSVRRHTAARHRRRSASRIRMALSSSRVKPGKRVYRSGSPCWGIVGRRAERGTEP
jgi:hypothetical protein